MEDSISRQEAIDILDAYQVMIENGEENPYSWARLRMSELSSAQPGQRWIPCSERLPEVGRSVLISVGGMYTAEGCLREDGDWTQFRWDAIQRKDMVGAWMPLPEPYREGEQDENR